VSDNIPICLGIGVHYGEIQTYLSILLGNILRRATTFVEHLHMITTIMTTIIVALITTIIATEIKTTFKYAVT